MDGIFPIILVSICGILLIALVGAFLSRLERRRGEKNARQRQELNNQRGKLPSAPIEQPEPENLIVSEMREIPRPEPVAIPLSAADNAKENEYVDASAIDLTTIEGLAAIPNAFFNVGPANAYGSFNNIGELLQKQATVYKKNGDSEMEIACLQKYMDIAIAQGGGYPPSVDRVWKELFRLRRFEESDRMKKIARDMQIKRNKENAARYYREIGDAPYVIESIPTCPKCYDLSQHIYSRSPKLQSEHILPPPESDVAERLYCDLCGCYMPAIPFFGFDGNSEPRPKIKIDYEELAVQGGERLSKRRAQIEYDWLYRNMPDDAPKSVAGYIKMKKANSDTFYKLQSKAQDRDYTLYDWMERWCHDPIEDYITED